MEFQALEFSGADQAAFGALGFGMILVIAVIALVITIIPFWMITKKAGYHPALSLLMLVPLANVIFPFFLAFAQWPSLQGSTNRING